VCAELLGRQGDGTADAGRSWGVVGAGGVAATWVSFMLALRVTEDGSDVTESVIDVAVGRLDVDEGALAESNGVVDLVADLELCIRTMLSD
jgi:endonuclease V-like protein UPF0215 family